MTSYITGVEMQSKGRDIQQLMKGADIPCDRCGLKDAVVGITDFALRSEYFACVDCAKIDGIKIEEA